MRSEWEHDTTFMAVAAVAWPEDFAVATRKPNSSNNAEYSARQSARARLKLRWDGFRHAEQVSAKVDTMKRAVDAMAAKINRMTEALRSE